MNGIGNNSRQPRTNVCEEYILDNEFVDAFKLNPIKEFPPILKNDDIRKLPAFLPRHKLIHDYFDNSKMNYDTNARIVQIWELLNVDEYYKFNQRGYNKENSMLLWHGTKRSNLVSILKESLREPRQGRGIYLADRVSKSLGYTDDDGGPSVLLLCQVALGKWSEKDIFNLPLPGYDYVKFFGQNIPDRSGDQKFSRMCIAPCGKTMNANNTELPSSHTRRLLFGYSFQFNEYVMVDPDRILIRYIIQCEHDRVGNNNHNNHNNDANNKC